MAANKRGKRERTMTIVAHEWIADVLTDLVEYSAINDLTETAAALVAARNNLTDEIGKKNLDERTVSAAPTALFVVKDSHET